MRNNCDGTEAYSVVWRDVGGAVERQELVEVADQLIRFRVDPEKSLPPPGLVSFLRQGVDAEL